MPTRCNTPNCINVAQWYSIIDESLFCDNCSVPIGSYVRLINPEWSRVWHIVERYLSATDVLDPSELTTLITSKDAQ